MNGKTHMLKNWSIDRTKHKRFISYVEITNDLYEISYNLIWHIKCSVVKMSSVEDTYLVSKYKYKHQLVIFEQLINNGYCVLDFDGLAEIIKQVSLIKINFSDWKESSCTCKYFAKKYFCAHIVVRSLLRSQITVKI
jgi:DNA repair photolyase